VQLTKEGRSAVEMKECAEKTDAFIERKRRELESIEILGSLVTECLRAPAVRMVVLSVLRNLLSSWSEGSRTKQKIFERALKLAEKNIAPQSPYSAGIDAQKVGKLLTLLAQSLNDKQKFAIIQARYETAAPGGSGARPPGPGSF
jgi:hypothetical protein